MYIPVMMQFLNKHLIRYCPAGQQQGSSKPDEDQTQGQLGGDNRWWCVCL